MNAYIIDAVRTPAGKYKGVLSSQSPADLMAHVIATLLARNQNINPQLIEEIIAGSTNHDAVNIAHKATLLADLPITISSSTVDKLCASGMQAIINAALALNNGNGNVYIAGGTSNINSNESSSYESAENIASHWKISRQQQDEYSCNSHKKYMAARQATVFDDEVAMIEVAQNGLVNWVLADEITEQNLETLAQLNPLTANGCATTGNTVTMAQGASALYMVSKNIYTQLELAPIAQIIAVSVAAVHPGIAGMACVPAIEKVLNNAGLTLADIGLVELHEASAAQMLACIHELNLNPNIVNVSGGALAIGHTQGGSGAAICTTLAHQMHRTKTKYGLATIATTNGQATAIIFALV
jgi:acetyl-CoA acetyltransferase